MQDEEVAVSTVRPRASSTFNNSTSERTEAKKESECVCVCEENGDEKKGRLSENVESPVAVPKLELHCTQSKHNSALFDHVYHLFSELTPHIFSTLSSFLRVLSCSVSSSFAFSLSHFEGSM